MHGQTQHLCQMAHGGLTAVILPVGIGDETHRRVEGEIGRNAVKMLRIERQIALQPLNRIKRNKARQRKGQKGQSIIKPVLLLCGLDPRKAVQAPLNRRKNRREKRALSRKNLRHIAAQRQRNRKHRQQNKRNLRPAHKCHGITFIFRIFRDG